MEFFLLHFRVCKLVFNSIFVTDARLVCGMWFGYCFIWLNLKAKMIEGATLEEVRVITTENKADDSVWKGKDSGKPMKLFYTSRSICMPNISRAFNRCVDAKSLLLCGQ